MAAEEQLVLDGLTLNDSTYGLETLSAPPPPLKPEWIGSADSEWQALARDPKHENREITARIAIAQQSTTNLAMDKIGAVMDKLRSASRTQSGIGLTWTPADGTRTVTFRVLAGEITDLPIDWESGWMSKAPTITIRMICKPYWEGTETLTSTTTAATPLITKEITGVTGEMPALGRLIVTDNASQSRRHVEWGIEGQYYNASTSLLIDSDDMVTSGFGGTQSTATGAYDPNASGNSVVTATLTTTNATAVAGTGNLSHIGIFRVKARVNHTVDDEQVEARFVWQVGDGPWTANEWVSLAQSLGSIWEEIDLGAITVPSVISGTQRWQGRVDARVTTSGTIFRLDYLELLPALEGYGKARAPTSSVASSVAVANDSFASTTAGNSLNATTSDSGHTWATSGDATDFVFSDAFGEELSRTPIVDTTTGRRAVLGSTNYTDTQVDLRFRCSGSVASGDSLVMGAIARWVDSSNFAYLTVERSNPGGAGEATAIRARVVVAGSSTLLFSVSPSSASVPADTWYRLRLLIYASGVALWHLASDAESVMRNGTFSSTALATGGALASGKPGIYDKANNDTAITRYYDDFEMATPSPEPIALYSGRNMQFRHDGAIRQDSSGTYAGDLPSYQPAARFLVPVGTSRVVVKARRNDVDEAADDNVTDSTQVQVGWTPRGIAVPR